MKNAFAAPRIRVRVSSLVYSGGLYLIESMKISVTGMSPALATDVTVFMVRYLLIDAFSSSFIKLLWYFCIRSDYISERCCGLRLTGRGGGEATGTRSKES